jgi:hypothetical protein
MPASSKPDAVLNLFAAVAGRPLALPYANNFLPLCAAALRLCEAFSWLLYHETRLDCWLMFHADRGWPLPEAETFRAAHEVLAAIQSTVADAFQVQLRLADIYADPRAGTMLAHPLTAYIEFELAPMALLYCKGVMEGLGMPGGITTGAGFSFNVHAALDDPRWPTSQASLLTEQRQGLLRHYVKFMQQIRAKARTEEERAQSIDDMQGLAAVHCAKRFGFKVPDAASGRARLLAAIQEATTLH